MRFLADECFDARVVVALRRAGHDVQWISEDGAGSSDEEVLRRAVRDGLILLTDDKGFGELVVRHARPSSGVILMRFPESRRMEKPNALLAAIERYGETLSRLYIVIGPDTVRARTA